MLDQGLDADLLSDIQKYLEDLISSGLRQRLISLIKVLGVYKDFFHSIQLDDFHVKLGVLVFPYIVFSIFSLIDEYFCQLSI